MNQSSHVVDAKYNDAAGTMLVTFKGGEKYEWRCPKSVCDELHYANSPGSFLRQWVTAHYGKGKRVA